MEKKKTNKKFLVIFAVLILVGGSYGAYKYIHSLSHETTDDAQVERHMNPIIPRVGGYITKVYVADNQMVKKGDTLFTIDDRDFRVKVEEAKAALIAAEASYEASRADIGTASANVSVSEANVQSAGGNIESAKIRLTRATNDFERYANLYKNRSITKQQYEQAEAAKRRAYEKSVIDFVLADVDGLKPKLGSSDQKKLDQYLTGVRELEKRVIGLDGAVSCTPGTPPPKRDGLDYPKHVQAMMDLITLAFSCDATRVVTLMFGNAVSGRTHGFLGINGGHHDISHHMNDPALIAQLAKIGAWEMEQFGYLLGKLKAAPDGEGQTLLYNSAVFCSSDISDGNRHNHDDMPIVLGGHGGGSLHPGQHVMYPAAKGMPKQKVSNLLVTMLEGAGITGAKLGDSTGPLSEL